MSGKFVVVLHLFLPFPSAASLSLNTLGDHSDGNIEHLVVNTWTWILGLVFNFSPQYSLLYILGSINQHDSNISNRTYFSVCDIKKDIFLQHFSVLKIFPRQQKLGHTFEIPKKISLELCNTVEHRYNQAGSKCLTVFLSQGGWWSIVTIWSKQKRGIILKDNCERMSQVSQPWPLFQWRQIICRQIMFQLCQNSDQGKNSFQTIPLIVFGQIIK